MAKDLCKDWKEGTDSMGCKTTVMNKWKTPATDYPLSKKGSAELTRKNYAKGIYMMEGVRDTDFFCVEKPIPVTNLKIKNKVVMVDDPLHQWGMEDLAKNSHGKVLVGGLGLGLIAHELAKNPRVEDIVVVEKNPDVIDLVGPLIPPKVRLKQGDIFDRQYSEAGDYDTIILDLWVKSGPKLRVAGESEALPSDDIRSAYVWWQYRNPDSDIFIWGVNNKKINPATTKTPCKAAQMIKGII